MAARKKPDAQTSLFAAPAPVSAPKPAIPPPAPPSEPAAQPPGLRLVSPAPERPEWDVSVEADERGLFWVTRVRDHGTTSAATSYTRSELERLIERASAALRVG